MSKLTSKQADIIIKVWMIEQLRHLEIEVSFNGLSEREVLQLEKAQTRFLKKHPSRNLGTTAQIVQYVTDRII